MDKKGAGSHNQDVAKALEHYQKSINLMQECRCILHKRGLKQGELIEKTNFNRQGSGTQSMCSMGKTLIDQIKHRFWRLTYVLSMELLTDSKNMPLYNKLINLPDERLLTFKENLKVIIESNYIKSIQNDFDISFNINDYFKLTTYLKELLTLKGLGFYKIYFEKYSDAYLFYENFKTIIEEITDIKNLKVIGEIIEDLLDSSEIQYFVAESSKENTYLNVNDVVYNWSKMNKIYQLINNEYVFTGLYGPYHNTKVTGVGEGCRLVKYLTEVNQISGSKEVSELLVKYKNSGLHGDHIFPLALGGQHTVENMQFITASENLKKNASLTFSSYLKVFNGGINSLNLMINKDVVPLFLEFYTKVVDDEIKFNANIDTFEKKLKFKMKERIKNFIEMDDNQRLDFLNKIRPDLSENRKHKFVERFFRHRKFSKNKDI